MAETDLDYAKVTGRFGITVGDTDDPGENPDIVWITQGRLLLTPRQTFTKVAAATPSPATLGQGVIECTFIDGYLTYRGLPRVYVVDLTSPKVNPVIGPDLATHRVTILDARAADGTAVTFPPYDVRLTAAGADGDGVNDLTLLAPVVPGESTPITRGPQGTSVQTLAVEAGDLVATFDDGTEVNAGALPVGPGGSDEGVASYLAGASTQSRAALDQAAADLLDTPGSVFATRQSASIDAEVAPVAATVAAIPEQYDPINGNIVVGLGDSTMQNEASDNPYNGATYRLQNAWLPRAAQVLKQRIRVAKMSGVWGDTTQQMIDRFDAAVTAHNPDVVLILGSRNDADVTTSLTNIATLVGKVRDIKATPIVCIPLPTLTSSADRQRMSTTATRLRAWCLANRVRTIDFYALTVDPATGGLLAAYDSGDAKHLNYAGVKAMSEHAATALSALIPAAPEVVALDKADTDSKVVNPFFEGISDPNNTGFTTGSWSIGFKPVSGFENYTTADVSGWTGKALDISTTPWAGGTVPSAQIRQNISISAGVMEVGDVIEWTGKFKIPTNTLPAGKRVQCALLFEGANVTVTAVDTNAPMTDEGVFRVRATIPAGTTSIRQQFLIPPDATGTARLQVNAIRCVNLTKLGAA